MASLMSLILHVVLVLSTSSSQAQTSDYTECSTKKSVLLQALYNTSDNFYQLESAFAPPSPGEISSRYIKVNYMFGDSEGKYGDCNVTYLWAIGGFLLAQPPKIFQFTSLYFSSPANERINITLKLPYECRDLIMAATESDGVYSIEDNNTCSCYDTGDPKGERLLVLTNQLNEYAKYEDPVNVVQDITSSAKTICFNKFRETKYFAQAEVKQFFSLIILIPIMVMGSLIVIIRSTHKEIHIKLTTTSNKGYQNLAGLMLASIYLQIYILCMDVAAVHYYRIDKHVLGRSARYEINIYSPAITLCFDFAITVMSLNLIFYLWCNEVLICKNLKLCKAHYFKFLISPYFYVVFGKKAAVMVRDINEPETQKICNTWVAAGVVGAPVFCLASHVGYILVAWVTEPARTTAAFLTGLGCFIYMFFMFRQCYIVYENEEFPSCCTANASASLTTESASPTTESGSPTTNTAPLITPTSERPILSVVLLLATPVVILSITPVVIPVILIGLVVILVTIPSISLIILCRSCWQCFKKTPPAADKISKLLQLEKPNRHDSKLSFPGLFVAFSMGWLIVGPVVFFISSFTLFPVSTFALTDYLESASQFVILVLGLLISYKVFTAHESDIEKFMRSFKKVFHSKVSHDTAGGNNNNRENTDVEAGGSSNNRENTDVEAGGSSNNTKDSYDTDVEAGGAIFGDIASKMKNKFL